MRRKGKTHKLLKAMQEKADAQNEKIQLGVLTTKNGKTSMHTKWIYPNKKKNYEL